MSKYSSKFSPGIKRFLGELKNDENPILSLIIRTKNNLDSVQTMELNNICAEIRTVAGDIVTLLIPVKNISMLAEKDFVLYLELTRPLYLEE